MIVDPPTVNSALRRPGSMSVTWVTVTRLDSNPPTMATLTTNAACATASKVMVVYPLRPMTVSTAYHAGGGLGGGGGDGGGEGGGGGSMHT